MINMGGGGCKAFCHPDADGSLNRGRTVDVIITEAIRRSLAHLPFGTREKIK